MASFTAVVKRKHKHSLLGIKWNSLVDYVVLPSIKCTSDLNPTLASSSWMSQWISFLFISHSWTCISSCWKGFGFVILRCWITIELPDLFRSYCLCLYISVWNCDSFMAVQLYKGGNLIISYAMVKYIGHILWTTEQHNPDVKEPQYWN